MRRIPAYTLAATGLAFLTVTLYVLSLDPSESSDETSEKFLRHVVIADLLESETPPVPFSNFVPPALPDGYVQRPGPARLEPSRTSANGSLRRVLRKHHVEQGMVLQLTGEVLLNEEWQSTDLQPEFSVLIDGKVVFEQSMALDGKNIIFFESIPLDSYADSTIDILLQSDDKNIPDSIACFSRALL